MNADTFNQAAAFGAIRRAATLIRAHERMGLILNEFGCFKSQAARVRSEARLMRLTIRAAIGSDKA